MKIALQLLLPLLCVTFSSYAQDTVKLEPSFYYSGKEYPVYDKSFAGLVQCAREDVVYSPTKLRTEYCYYYDNERRCYGTDYEVLNDTTLLAGEEVWQYRKQGNAYLFYRYYNGTYEEALSATLLPFMPLVIVTTTTDRIDTLWTTDFTAVKRHNTFSIPLWKFYKTPVKGKVWKADKVEQPPLLLNGDSIPAIKLARTDACYCEPYITVYTLKFIVTAQGRIINIEQLHGNVSLTNCPYYVMDLIRYVLQWGHVKPATRKGKPVNAEWVVKVDMMR